MNNFPQSALKHPLLLVALWISLLVPAHATAAEREHGAHVHGVGALNAAVDGPTVEIEFESPGANIVGFEHAAKTDADRRAIANATATLKAGDKLFAFPAAAGCRLTESKVEAPSLDDHNKHGHDKHGHGHDKHGKGEEAHSEFHAHYQYRCDRPADLTHIDINIFRLFPATEELKVQAISPRGQRAQTLTSKAPRLMF
ncbi:MAG: DUF2796 domain-containing protein [Alphaproteobacteria bacterium]|nr:DUF2796 domain-containing protein [Alphaproteobacteria bacterium]